MKTLGLIGMAVMGVATMQAGCGSTSGARSEPAATASTAPSHEHGMGTMNAMCPVKIPGTTVTSTDVDGGVALVFTTTSDVAELRQRVHRMAEMHHQHHAGGMMTSGQVAADTGAEHKHDTGPTPGHGGDAPGKMMMPAATASVEDVAGGARIVLRPTDPGQLDALREHARTRASGLARGECPMMSPHAEDHATPPAGPGHSDHADHPPK